MAIDDFRSLMLPLLELASDGKLRHLSEYKSQLDDGLLLEPEERGSPPSSSPRPMITSRVAWAAAYLHRAQLLQRPKRGYYRISRRGARVLAEQPETIDIYLQQFSEFIDWQVEKQKHDVETRPAPAPRPSKPSRRMRPH